MYPLPNATIPYVLYNTGPWPKEIDDDIHWFFFSIHYLSLCGGYVGGTEDPDYYFLQCERKAGGWRFRTDDPYIVNFLSVDGQFPVNSTVPLQTFTTAPAFGTLVIGITFSVFGVGLLAAEVFGGWLKSGRLAQTSVWLLAVCEATLRGNESYTDCFKGAATFLTISSALITSTIRQTDGPQSDYGSWVSGFEALTWSAVAFTYVAFIWKLSDFVYQQEKRRRLLTTGQI
jgi:hypothetical protein